LESLAMSFGNILESVAMPDVGEYNEHLVYLMAI
jgi:hypothetical protein